LGEYHRPAGGGDRDGCKGGWLCVTRDTVTGELASAVYPTAEALVLQQPALALLCIDIPIGLCDRGPRECDAEARKFIQARRSSVFPAPLRPMLDARTYEEVCQIGLANGGKKLSRQGWAIVPKIREVDQVLRNRAGAIPEIREVHPEVCFAAWAGSPMRHRKRGREGRQQRQRLVGDHFGGSAYDEVRKRHPGPLVASDDILDAFAALRTAERVLAGAALTLPSRPPTDRCGLAMEIVY
jgi:predicted RNase H-like nuclease